MPGNNCTFAGTAAEWGLFLKNNCTFAVEQTKQTVEARYRQPANRLSTLFNTLSISLPIIPMVSMPTIMVSV